MDPVTRVKDYLLDNIGHMTRPGNASFDPKTKRWFVPVYFRTKEGDVALGDVEVDGLGHILFAPSREQLLSRLTEPAASMTPPTS
jgi:hypothetical protein